MSIKISLLAALLCLNGIVNAQTYGSKSEGLANISQYHNDVFSIINNPSGISKIDKPSAATYFSRPYGLRGLENQFVGIVVPGKMASHGLSYYQTGHGLYRIIQANYAIAKKLSDKLSLGTYTGFKKIVLEEVYGQKTLIIAGFSVLYKIDDENKFAVCFHNPHRPRLTEYQDERVLNNVLFSYSKIISPLNSAIIEFENNWQNNTIVRFGVEQTLSKNLSFRIGYSSIQSLFSFGISHTMRQIEIAASYSYHPNLGYIPSISFYYSKAHE